MPHQTVTRAQDPDRFEIAVDDRTAGFTQFVDHDGQRIFFHTVIEDEFGGQGLAASLVQEALERTRADGVRIVPVCPYVARFLTKTDEFADIVDEPTDESRRLARRAAR